VSPGLRRFAARAFVLALLAVTGDGCGCVTFEFTRTYAVDDAQIAIVLGGTSEPTPSGCRAVCTQERSNEFGLVGDAGSGSGEPVQRCSIAEHTLTCIFVGTAC
jgi:hypothetical protein